MPTAIVLLVIVLPLVVLLAGARRPSAVSLVVVDGQLRIAIGGLDGFFALKGSLSFPVAAVQGVAVVPSRHVARTGLRLPGTAIPGVLRAGSYGTGAQRDFWLVRKESELLVVVLAPGAAYRKVVLGLPDPHATATALALPVWNGPL